MRLPAMILGVVLASWLGAAPAAAGYDDGAAAFIRGDYSAAWREWMALGKQGHQSAQYNLGVLYSIGLGVNQDDTEAFKWFQRAADRGLPAAQMRLGGAYLDGRGVLESREDAYFWFSLAATHFSLGEQHEQAVAARENAGAGLTRAQITEVLEKAMSWRPLPQTIEDSEKQRLIASPDDDAAIAAAGVGAVESGAMEVTSNDLPSDAAGGGEETVLETSAGLEQEGQAAESTAQATESGGSDLGGAQAASLESGAEAVSGTTAVEAQGVQPDNQVDVTDEATDVATGVTTVEATGESTGESTGETTGETTAGATGGASGETNGGEASGGDTETSSEENPIVQVATATGAEDSAIQEPSGEAVAVTGESFVAHLSSVQSEDGTRAEWRNLQSLFPQQLREADLTVRTVEIADQGTFYRVMAGPFEARAQAETICAELKPQDQYCHVYRLTD